ncbi:ATP-binding protein [Amycolatopsis sp. NPDC051106]|uniref:ATP-binding protein n=1 Tax=unclassified Amycolatopsis TaxID=2618356 RepID=UPI0034373328
MTIEQTRHSTGELRVVALEVADDLSELAAVRAWADRLLLDLPDDARHAVVTVVDELTSNALRHGEPPRQVRLLRRANWLCVEVDDACLEPACSHPSMGASPHGLGLVANLSVAWGQWQRSTGKTVWAEITFDAA